MLGVFFIMLVSCYRILAMNTMLMIIQEVVTIILTKKDTLVNIISDKNSFISKLCATENEYTPNGLDKKSKDKDSEVTNYNKSTQQ